MKLLIFVSLVATAIFGYFLLRLLQLALTAAPTCLTSAS